MPTLFAYLPRGGGFCACWRLVPLTDLHPPAETGREGFPLRFNPRPRGRVAPAPDFTDREEEGGS